MFYGDRATVLSPFLSSPFSKGEMLSVFFFLCFFVSGLVVFLSFFFPFFFSGGRCLEKIFGSELLFSGCRFWSCVFWCCFAYVFALLFAFVAPETVLKNSLRCQVWCFWVVFFLPLVFFADVVVFLCFFFLFKRDSSGSNRAHPHTHLFCLSLFLFLCPAALACSPFLAVRPASWCFPWGAILGPSAFLGFSWYSSEALFLDARRQGCFWCFFCLVFVFPRFVVFCGCFFTRTRRGGPVIVRGIPPGHRTRPAPE